MVTKKVTKRLSHFSDFESHLLRHHLQLQDQTKAKKKKENLDASEATV